MIANTDIGLLFDLIEFICRHKCCSEDGKKELAGAFVQSRAAYRIIDGNQIVAIGVQQEADTYLSALDQAAKLGAIGPRAHLIQAGRALKEGRWDECIRESIHAVESVALDLAPGASTPRARVKAHSK